MDHKSIVSVMRSDKDTVFVEKAGTVFKKLDELVQPETILTIIPHNWRWIVEFGADDYLYFDFLIPGEKEFFGVFGACPL